MARPLATQFRRNSRQFRQNGRRFLTEIDPQETRVASKVIFRAGTTCAALVTMRPTPHVWFRPRQT